MNVNVDDQLIAGLRVFVAVAESGSFTRAASALRLTQSGVSRAISRLEHRIGARLFYRTARAIALSDDGRRLHASVAPLLEGIEAATVEALGGAATVRGTVRVNADSAVAQYLLAPRLHKLLAMHPHLSIELDVRDRLVDFAAEGYDVAVRFGELNDSSLVCRRLFETRVLTCASRAYLARRPAPKHPRDLDQHERIHFRDPLSGKPFEWELRRERTIAGKRQAEVVAVPAKGRLVVNDPASLLAACEAGCGIAQTLECYVRPYLDDGRLVQLLPDWSDERFPVYLYHHGGPLVPARVRTFIDFVLAHRDEFSEVHKPTRTARKRARHE